MNLYRIQYDGMNAFVVATTMVDAIAKWQRAFAEENDGDLFEPDGCEHVADGGEIIIGDGWASK